MSLPVDPGGASLGKDDINYCEFTFFPSELCCKLSRKQVLSFIATLLELNRSRSNREVNFSMFQKSSGIAQMIFVGSYFLATKNLLV